MQINNRKNMPEVLLHALQGNMEDASKADYRVTMLCSPPRIACLKKRHKDEIEYDAFDLYHSMLGNSIHEYIQRGLTNNERYITEHRLLSDLYGRVISGTLDCYDKETETLIDHKTVSTYVYSMPDKQEWTDQTNIYAYLLETLTEHKVNRIQIHLIFKDWRENAGRYSGMNEYPPKPTMLIDVPLLPYEERKQLFESRLRRLIELEATPDDELPLCSAEQMWEKPATFALYKQGAQRATKLCPSMKDALEYKEYKGVYGKDLLIEHRQGSRTRCEKYCDVAPYCNQYQQWLKERDTEVSQAIEENKKITS